MKASEMERLLANWDDDTDIYIETEDGLLHEFKFTERPATFDGFDTEYKAGINLQEWSSWWGCNVFRSAMSVGYDLGVFCGVIRA